MEEIVNQDKRAELVRMLAKLPFQLSSFRHDMF